MDSNLLWLLNWFYKNCNGDWEHGSGVSIGTLDNPGWFLKISLDDTELEEKPFNIVDVNRTEDDWIYAEVENREFKAFGGPFNLPEMLKLFQNWVEN